MKVSRFVSPVALCASLFNAVGIPAIAHTRAIAEPDVLVVGGTPAGVAAALAAARRGERVTLVSESGDLGGVLTGAMMDQWDLNTAVASAPIERGIFAEMYARLGDAFTSAAAATLCARLIAREPRIAVRFDERVTAVQTVRRADGERVSAVTFADARTRASRTLHAPVVVDATDFGDVAALAGAKYDIGRQDTGVDDRMQAVTEMFSLQGIDWDALADSYDVARDGAGGVIDRRAWGFSAALRDYEPLSSDVVVRDLNLGRLPDGTVTVNAVDVLGIDGRDPKALDRARRLTEREAPHLLAYLRARVPGFERARIGAFAPDVYVRETRHIAGHEVLTAGEIWAGRVPADSIGLASYPIDLHPVDATDRPAFAPVRHVYGVPFGALVPGDLVNVLVASPAISASHLASGSARTIPTTIEEGEAAGAACALALRRGVDVATFAGSERDVAALRDDLTANGAVVGTPTGDADRTAFAAAKRTRRRTSAA